MLVRLSGSLVVAGRGKRVGPGLKPTSAATLGPRGAQQSDANARGPEGPGSLLQELVLHRGALGAEVDEEGAGGRARPQLLQLVVMRPLDVAPLLDLIGGQDGPLGGCQVLRHLPATVASHPQSRAWGGAGQGDWGPTLPKHKPHSGEATGENLRVSRAGTQADGVQTAWWGATVQAQGL